jgi:hypothetical protein
LTEHKIGAEPGRDDGRRRQQRQLGADAPGGMIRLIIEQPLDAHKPHGGDYDHCHSDRDKRSPVVTAERAQQSFELYPGSRIGRARSSSPSQARTN